jgi:hypothetical protein
MKSWFRPAMLLILLGNVFSLQALDEATLMRLKEKAESEKGKVKVELLQKIASHYLADHHPEGIFYAKEALNEALRHPRPSARREAWIFLAEANRRLQKPGEARSCLIEAENLNQDLDPKGIADLSHFCGQQLFQLAYYADAETRFRKEIELREQLANDSLCALSHRSLARVYLRLGHYHEALTHLHQALEEADSYPDSLLYFVLVEELGSTHSLLGKKQKAQEEFRNLLAFRSRHTDTAELARAHLFLAGTEHELGSQASAILHAKAAFDLFREIEDPLGEAESLHTLALPYLSQERWETAALYLSLALEKLEALGEYKEIPAVMGSLGFARIKLGFRQEGLTLLQQALNKAKVNRMLPLEASLTRRLYEVHESLGNYRQSLTYLKAYTALKDSLFNEEKARITQELEIEYGIRQQQKQLAALMSDQEHKRLYNWLQIGGLAALLIITLVIINRQRIIIRKDQMLHEKEKQILQTREQLTSAELQNTLNELEYNRSRLEIYMQGILAKNDMVEKMVAEVKSLEGEHGMAESQEKQAKVAELMELKILTEEDWLTFKQHFEQVYPGFFPRLTEDFPRLTPGELRLCALIKLGLTTRPIANILGISPDSVKKSRQRLRKKLNLSEKEKLQGVISHFE